MSDSSSPTTPEQQQQRDYSVAEQAARLKDEGRASRFTFRNYAEHKLRQELKDEAVSNHCKDFIKDFAECAELNGFFVVFKCQSEMKKVNECLSTYSGDAAWERYKEENKSRLENMAKMRKQIQESTK